MRRLKSSVRRSEKNSPESEFCVMCFKAVETSSNLVSTEGTEELIASTYNYLQARIASKYYDIADLENKKVLYCKNCFDCALQLTQLTEQLNTLEDGIAKINLENKISDLTANFSLSVLNRRDMFHSNISNNKTLETNESGSELKGIPGPSGLFLLNGNSTGKSINGQEHTVPDIVSEHENTDCEDDEFSLGYSLSSAVEEVENVDININDLDQNIETLQEEEETVVTKAPVTNGMTAADILKTIRMPSVTIERIDGKKVKRTTENTTKEHRTLTPMATEDTTKEHRTLTPMKTEDTTEEHRALTPIPLEGVLRRSPEKKRLNKQSKSTEVIISERQLLSTTTIKKVSLVESVKTRLKSKRPLIPQKDRKMQVIYKCFHCWSTYSRAFLLKLHYKIHQLKKDLKCSVCEKKFNYPAIMEGHLLVHDKEQYTCTHCNKLFRSSKNFEKHMRLHRQTKPYKCKFCNKGFRDKSGWQKHLQIHEKEKPSKRTRAQHQNIHSGAKSYKCTLCPESFQSSGARKKHFLLIHKKGEKRLTSQRSCKK